MSDETELEFIDKSPMGIYCFMISRGWGLSMKKASGAVFNLGSDEIILLQIIDENSISIGTILLHSLQAINVEVVQKVYDDYRMRKAVMEKDYSLVEKLRNKTQKSQIAPNILDKIAEVVKKQEIQQKESKDVPKD